MRPAARLPVTADDTITGGSSRGDAVDHALHDLLPDAFFVASPAGRYLEVNRVGCELFGMTPDQVLRSRLEDLVSPAEHHRLAQAVKSYADGRVHRSEWRFRRGDGSEFPGELHGRQLPDGRLVGVVRDISERRLAFDAVNATEDKYRALFDSIDQGFCIIEVLFDERGAPVD